MSFIDIVFLLILWMVLPLFVVFEYLKLNAKQKGEILEEVKGSRGFIVVLLLVLLGFLIFFTGIITSETSVKYLGIFIFLVAWLLAGIELWNTNIKRSLLFISLSSISLVIFIIKIILPVVR
ncbi:hypothetical protein IM538_04105 [Cytobacillus suaedae]|nr:hypothetical protein IM538_04105 [Cytobacillus suaedae]